MYDEILVGVTAETKKSKICVPCSYFASPPVIILFVFLKKKINISISQICNVVVLCTSM